MHEKPAPKGIHRQNVKQFIGDMLLNILELITYFAGRKCAVFVIHRRSKVSVQNSQAGQHDESRHNFKVVYIHQLGHYASLLSVLLLN